MRLSTWLILWGFFGLVICFLSKTLFVFQNWNQLSPSELDYYWNLRLHGVIAVIGSLGIALFGVLLEPRERKDPP